MKKMVVQSKEKQMGSLKNKIVYYILVGFYLIETCNFLCKSNEKNQVIAYIENRLRKKQVRAMSQQLTTLDRQDEILNQLRYRLTKNGIAPRDVDCSVEDQILNQYSTYSL